MSMPPDTTGVWFVHLSALVALTGAQDATLCGRRSIAVIQPADEVRRSLCGTCRDALAWALRGTD